MPPECRQRLDALSFVWDAQTTKWEEGFRNLTLYRQREGHCLVPGLYREHSYRLGTWVSHQRNDKDTMPPDRRQRLDALGFVWNIFDRQWEKRFAHLQRFHEREGHCLVPANHREQDVRLGLWVAVQRRNKDTISPDRRRRLDALDFVWKLC